MKTFLVKSKKIIVAEGIQFTQGTVVVLWENYKGGLKAYTNVEDLLNLDVYNEDFDIVWKEENSD